MKQCHKCLRLLPLESFHKHPATKDKLDGRCKQCKKEGQHKLPKICEHCGKSFLAAKPIPKVRRGRFCSKKCQFSFMTGDKSHRWRGGKKISKGGYIYIFQREHPHSTKNGYVLEHRLLMEKKIGRYLTKEEVVHHINSNTKDNRIENLELFSNQGEHLSYHNTNGRTPMTLIG
jgi:hypothetical protein